MPTVLTHNEVADLEKLRAIAKQGDVTVSWWIMVILYGFIVAQAHL